jgi:hypothetical protein
MASELSDYAANAFLNWVKSTAFPADPAAVYVALFNGNPTSTGLGGTEVTTTLRPAGRVAVTFGSIVSREIVNSADVAFGNAAAGASITHFAIFDAASSGNMIAFSPLDASRTISTGDPVTFLTGTLKLNFN